MIRNQKQVPMGLYVAGNGGAFGEPFTVTKIAGRACSKGILCGSILVAVNGTDVSTMDRSQMKAHIAQVSGCDSANGQ